MGILCFTTDLSGYGSTMGAAVVFVGLLHSIAVLTARTYLTGESLNVPGAAVLRRVLIAFACTTAVLGFIALIPLAVQTHIRGEGLGAALAGGITAVVAASTLKVAPRLRP
ncbi:hypothetical protein ACOBQX_28780 [Actinokineospora sp. G85]|uniref:hypothetical protein n=1 Tax=Actinokineospora sp. G85 TaxID=3406626 RepID=UPI003C73FD33